MENEGRSALASMSPIRKFARVFMSSRKTWVKLESSTLVMVFMCSSISWVILRMRGLWKLVLPPMLSTPVAKRIFDPTVRWGISPTRELWNFRGSW